MQGGFALEILLKFEVQKWGTKNGVQHLRNKKWGTTFEEQKMGTKSDEDFEVQKIRYKISDTKYWVQYLRYNNWVQNFRQSIKFSNDELHIILKRKYLEIGEHPVFSEFQNLNITKLCLLDIS